MQKFLSILMLVCLLCGLALPARAEGEPAQLYAKLNDGNWSENLNITQGQSVTVLFATENSETAVPITGEIQVSDTAITISGPASEGNSYTLTASSVLEGSYTLSYEQDGTTYSMTVTVTAPTTNTISVPDVATLSSILSDQSTFDAFLTTNHYSGSGDLTLVLPAENLGNVTCNVQLPGDATLTIKGASGKTVAGLTIEVDNICVDSVTFEGTSGVTMTGLTVKSAESCIITNCTFKNTSTSFALHLVQDESAPLLILDNNTFNGGCNVELIDGSGTVGAWQSTSYDKTKLAVIDFGAKPNKTNSENGCIIVVFPGDMKTLTEDGWTFDWNFVTADGYNKAFVVYDGENIDSTVNVNNNKITFAVENSGTYTIAKGTLPELVDKDATTKTLKFTPEQTKYLDKFTTTCKFKAVKITDKDGNPVKWEKDSDDNLTIWLKGKSPYTIKDVSTTTVTKASTTTTTTKRSYNYKYQDYYLITPQRVTDCMRYAKDNLVTIECKEAGRRSISLPVASMAAAAEKGYSILLKNEKIANITMDPAALKSMAQQAKGTTVLLHYRSLNHKTLTSVGLASVQSHLEQFPNDNADLAFLLTATSDSETIEDLQLGTITLKIPFIVLPGTEEMKNEVYALQSETAASARETTVADGHLTTKLTDLTEHMVFQIGEPVETTEETTEPTVETTVETTQPETEPETVPETTAAPEPEEEEKGFPIWIPIVAVLLLGGGGAAAWFLYFRKRFKK